jgi:3-isopropylmalate dehydrogenase
MLYKIALLPGDGVGPEVVSEARKVLEAVEKKYGVKFSFTEGLVGGAAIDAVGVPLPDETFDIAKNSDAILFGAVGGPKWDNLERKLRPEQAILKLRKQLELYANLRPAMMFQSLIESSPLKKDIVGEKLDIMIVRELTAGLYFGIPKGRRQVQGKLQAFDTMSYTEDEIERVAHIAFKIAQNRNKHVVSVDKANILETSRLWRETVVKVSKQYKEVTLSHMYVDNCAMQIILNPRQFDVILTENTFGDILSDESSVLTGSIGMLPSASLGNNKPFLYEPIHGSAPDIAGTNKANPVACILSCAMMLRHSFGLNSVADAVENAVEMTLNEGYRTFDMKSTTVDSKKVLSTTEFGDIIRQFI